MSSFVVGHASKCARGQKFNRDFHVIQDDAEAGLFVAVGSTYGRDVSTPTAVEAITTNLRHSHTSPSERIVETLRIADQRLVLLSEAEGVDDDDWRWDPDAASSVVAGLTQDTICLAWVGHCRAYLLRDGRVQAVTEEHSLLRDYRTAKGPLTPEEERSFPHPNVMTRALGVKPVVGDRVEIEANGAGWAFQQGDALLLCTQGLYLALSDDEIAVLASREKPAKALVRAAQNKTLQAATAVVVRHSGGGRLPTATALIRD